MRHAVRLLLTCASLACLALAGCESCVPPGGGRDGGGGISRPGGGPLQPSGGGAAPAP